MKVGVFGGTRHIGFELVSRLLSAGADVTIFNRGRTAPPAPFPRPVAHVRGDRNLPKDVGKFLVNEYDVVFDLSGYTPAHVIPVLNHHVKIKQYIFCSTSSVYRVPPVLHFREDAPHTVEHKTYGGAKAACEDLIACHSKAHGWPVTIFRPQGVIGEHSAAAMEFVVGRLLAAKSVFLDDQRDIKMKFVDVRDLADAFILSARGSRAYGRSYNICGDDVVDEQDFIRLCAQAIQLEPRIQRVNKEHYKGADIGIPWSRHDLVCDATLVKQDLSLKFTPLKETLEHIWLAWTDRQKVVAPTKIRGEQFMLDQRPIPFWLRTSWKLKDAIAEAVRR